MKRISGQVRKLGTKELKEKLDSMGIDWKKTNAVTSDQLRSLLLRGLVSNYLIIFPHKSHQFSLPFFFIKYFIFIFKGFKY